MGAAEWHDGQFQQSWDTGGGGGFVWCSVTVIPGRDRPRPRRLPAASRPEVAGHRDFRQRHPDQGPWRHRCRECTHALHQTRRKPGDWLLHGRLMEAWRPLALHFRFAQLTWKHGGRTLRSGARETDRDWFDLACHEIASTELPRRSIMNEDKPAARYSTPVRPSPHVHISCVWKLQGSASTDSC